MNKLDLDDKEEWQGSALLVRDAWIELTQELCERNQVNTSDINQDKVVERLERLKLDKTDDKIYFLAKDSFNLSLKHHKREITRHEAIACVISSIVSMQMVIQEILHPKT